METISDSSYVTKPMESVYSTTTTECDATDFDSHEVPSSNSSHERVMNSDIKLSEHYTKLSLSFEVLVKQSTSFDSDPFQYLNSERLMSAARRTVDTGIPLVPTQFNAECEQLFDMELEMDESGVPSMSSVCGYSKYRDDAVMCSPLNSILSVQRMRSRGWTCGLPVIEEDEMFCD
mmetsp:Transcript_7121/g.12789  ORF Transcript_7121/g.12789 Transcript_7121/m.12789 type:complete len:176 (-) Transcript_7121:395-922(-)